MSDDQQGPRAWADRIVGSGVMAPDQFLANPGNFRIHSALQEEALEEVLQRVGWVRRVLVNRRTGHVIDGHLRVSAAIRRGETAVPYDEVDLSEEDEKLVLAALDPIAGMAGTDAEKLAELLGSIDLAADGSLQHMLEELEKAARSHGAAQQEAGQGDPARSGALAERFLVPPFSVLNAREGWWQDRKRAWIALGIQSELGRGGTAATPSHPPTVTRNDSMAVAATKRKKAATV